MLKHQLCRYYDERNISDIDHLPRVTEKNVLILKYYSFENYFFNPDVMANSALFQAPKLFMIYFTKNGTNICIGFPVEKNWWPPSVMI